MKERKTSKWTSRFLASILGWMMLPFTKIENTGKDKIVGWVKDGDHELFWTP